MNPRVSIVIPVYNGSNYLGEAIDSALGQTHKNIEVIVVNDGSSDDGATRRVAESYSGKIRYFEKPNGGVASALNFGISEMTGDFFSWLSHDDLYLPDKIESQLNCLAKTACDRGVIVYGNCAIFTQTHLQARTLIAPDAGMKYFRYLLATSSAVHGCTLLVPKMAFLNKRFDIDKPTTQDYDMWFRLAGEFDYVKLDKTLVLARQHPGQDSVKKRKQVRKEKNAIYCSFIAMLRPEDVNPEARLSPASAYMSIAGYYAKLGLVDAAFMSVRKSICYANPHKLSEISFTYLQSACVCAFGIPWGFVRARVADTLKAMRVVS